MSSDIAALEGALKACVEALGAGHEALNALSVSPSEYAESDDATRCWCPCDWSFDGHCPMCLAVVPLYARVEVALAAARSVLK